MSLNTTTFLTLSSISHFPNLPFYRSSLGTPSDGAESDLLGFESGRHPGVLLQGAAGVVVALAVPLRVAAAARQDLGQRAGRAGHRRQVGRARRAALGVVLPRTLAVPAHLPADTQSGESELEAKGVRRSSSHERQTALSTLAVITPEGTTLTA